MDDRITHLSTAERQRDCHVRFRSGEPRDRGRNRGNKRVSDSALYNRDILRLATALVAHDHLENPDGSAEVRSPVCGSRMQADVSTDANGHIRGLALRANACALGQASAAILRQNADGLSLSILNELRDGIAHALKREGEMPAIWPELDLLSAASDYPSRHAAILLPYDAVLAAAQNITEKS